MAGYLTPQTLGVAAALLGLLVYYVYRTLLPKPIPHIPYNAASAKRVTGDVPDLMKWKTETGSPFGWIPELANKLNTPVFQLFMRPGGRPWVICMDPYEGYDVRMRRSKEFDRSDFFGDVFATLLPRFHVHMPMGEEWKAHRRLISDTMSPTFLAEVAAPQMWRSTQNIMDLWRTKARLAEGRPFEGTEDLYKGALDIIWAATFGSETGSAKAQTKYLTSLGKMVLPSSSDEEVKFPETPDPPEFTSIHTLTLSMDIPMASPFPKPAHWLALNFMPKYISARRHKDRMINTALMEAQDRFMKMAAKEDIESDFRHYRSALDLVVAREVQMAAKQGRKPDCSNQVLRDELYGFLLAGQDTTATTISWILKHLTSDQAIQNKFREELRAAYKRAAETISSPSVEEISSTEMPYLDAIIAEGGRVGLTAVGTIRNAKEDTTVLGYHIPKGTDVLFMTNGPGFIQPAMHVDDETRSKSSRENMSKLGSWDPEGIERFSPERWLKEDENGKTFYDEHAGPSVPFGNGPRGCFGRKWALLEMKIILTLVFWQFELMPTPEALSNFRAIDGVTHRAEHMYVRLKPLM